MPTPLAGKYAAIPGFAGLEMGSQLNQPQPQGQPVPQGYPTQQPFFGKKPLNLTIDAEGNRLTSAELGANLTIDRSQQLGFGVNYAPANFQDPMNPNPGALGIRGQYSTPGLDVNVNWRRSQRPQGEFGAGVNVNTQF